MVCTTPPVPSSKSKEIVKFAEQSGKNVSNFTKPLQLPSALDPSVLSYKSQTATYYVKELEDPKIVQPFVDDSVETAIGGSCIVVDKSAIIQDVSNLIDAFVGAAKATPTFSGFSSTAYSGTYSGTEVVYKVIIAVYIADVSELYESDPESVFELAYFSYLVVHKVDK